MTAEPEVIVSREGAAGVLLINRPKALNAITHTIVKDMARALTAWENDPAVTRVIVKGAGDRAFSAGGDIRVVHDLGKAGRHDEALAFWRDEYILNRQIKRYPKPYVALIDGIVMGGGVGVSVHGSHRVAGSRFNFAMPEVGIGFFPDVGATYFLPRLPFHAGSYLALTGARINRADALELGLATHAADSASFAAIEDDLKAGGDVDATLARHAVPKEHAPILDHHGLIDRVFGLPSLAEIVEALENASLTSDFAARTLATMKTKSPLSMALSLEQMRRGARLSFESAMTLEMRIVTRVAHGTDFYEGVRAVIIDKDQKPVWSPARIEDVDPHEVARYFSPLPNDLVF